MRMVRILGNWLFIASSPIWVLPMFIGVVALAFSRDDDSITSYATGKTWIL